MLVNLYCGNCLDVLQQLGDGCVDSIVTDPPYGINFLGKKWDYDVPSVDIWEQCLRVLKPGGHLLAFASTRTQHRMATRIEDAGFEIRDMLSWVYGSGFPKSHNVGKAIKQKYGNEDWEGWGTTLKPAVEPITMARKPLEKSSVADNVVTYGTGALNIDACRIEGRPPSKPQPLLGVKDRATSCALAADAGRNGTMSGASGRFPANLIHDGSEEVVSFFPDQVSGGGRKGEVGLRNYLDVADSKSLSGKRGGLGVGGELLWDDDRKCHYTLTAIHDARGNASRFFYCPKASKSERNEGLLKGDNAHPTVKPTDLMAYLCRLATPAGGVVLDPFMGSGSTGKAAVKSGFRFIGIEKDDAFFKVSEARINHAIAGINT